MIEFNFTGVIIANDEFSFKCHDAGVRILALKYHSIGPMKIDPEDFKGTYSRWVSGKCPCCGSDLGEDEGTCPQTIAEGVVLCGRCIRQEHHLTAGVVEGILLALVKKL